MNQQSNVTRLRALLSEAQPAQDVYTLDRLIRAGRPWFLLLERICLVTSVGAVIWWNWPPFGYPRWAQIKWDVANHLGDYVFTPFLYGIAIGILSTFILFLLNHLRKRLFKSA